jgi:hypothetical protein
VCYIQLSKKIVIFYQKVLKYRIIDTYNYEVGYNLIVNVDGYKMIFFIENLLREYVNTYMQITDINESFKEKLQDTAKLNGETEIENFEILLKYSHIGELVDLIKSKNFKSKKRNTIESINVVPLIRHRNNIMHSRSITADEMQNITKICDSIVNSLDENSFENRWNQFKVQDINNFEIPRVYIEYPVGKNFDKLIGRNEELKNLKRQLKIPIPVSIVGHGGLGKTALVLQLIEDYIFSPEQPFERIYFMSFKNTVFENGTIRRFEKVISNHKELIYKLAACIGLNIEKYTFEEIENLVWEDIFSKKSLLILDNLETEIVKSNLTEFTAIAQRFISNFNKQSRLIITSRYGLGDREAKFPLHQFDVTKTRELIESHLGLEFIKEKQISEIDWQWIQSYTKGNPGLIIAFCNTLRSTRKKLMDLRVEFDTEYTYESRELHSQLDEFLQFCFENTIESLNEASQIFISILCYLCSETNISEVNEEFLTYLRDELGLISLGDENLKANILVNIGFLQPIANSDRYYVNELFIEFLDGNFSDKIFNVFALKQSEWFNKVEKLKNHINELQFQEEISLEKLLSELYMSMYRSVSDKKYLIRAFFCQPTIENLINYYKKASETEIINHFYLLDKISKQLKDTREETKQQEIIKIILTSLLRINSKILSKEIINIRQSDLLYYFKQLEERFPILQKRQVNTSIRQLACKLLTYLQQYKLAKSFLNDEEELVIEKFNLLVKQLGDLSGTYNDECKNYIQECKEIIRKNPEKISKFSQAQFKIYSSRYVKKYNPSEALKILDNFEQYFISGNLKLFIFYLESLLIRMECLLKIGANIKDIIAYKDRFDKQLESPYYSRIFKKKREGLEQHYSKIKREISQYKQTINK